MGKSFVTLLLLVSFLMGETAVTSVDLASLQWKEKGSRTGVQRYRQKDPSGKLVAVRGTAIIDAPLEMVLTILLDASFERQKEWVPNLKAFEVLSQNTLFHRTLYVHVGLSWPVQDRDFSYRSDIVVNPSQQEVVVHYVSLDTLAPLKKEVVRGSMQTMFILTQLSEGKTLVDLRALADPRGAIPRFAINLAQRDYSEGMLSKIRDRVAQEQGDREVHPDFRALFEDSSPH